MKLKIRIKFNRENMSNVWHGPFVMRHTYIVHILIVKGKIPMTYLLLVVSEAKIYTRRTGRGRFKIYFMTEFPI